MAGYIAVPLKKPSEVDLVKPLKRFIETVYVSKGESVDQFLTPLNEFNKLRTNAISKSLDRHESGLEALYRCVLENMGNSHEPCVTERGFFRFLC